MGKILDYHWPKGAVAYQIYPRSFKDSNGDGIGDLPGITEKLDYVKDIGFNTVWISPFYPSSMADFGYDISNYCDVDPIFGNLEDFDKLLKKAHKLNIKVLIDFVPNHTSSKHPWFLESRSSKDNPKRDFYIWKDEKSKGLPPNNWLAVFGGSAWEFDKKTSQYYLHSFLKEQPDLNWENSKVKREMGKVLRFWLDKGVDGIRVDAVHWLGKDKNFRDDLPNHNFKKGDDPYTFLVHKYSKGHQGVYKVLNFLGSILKEYEGRFMVTEAYADERGDVVDYLKFYKECDNNILAPFNFEAIYLPWDAKVISSYITKYQKALKKGDLPVYVLGNHDRPRIASKVGKKQARVAAMMLLTLPGIPFVYSGDELGMENVEIPANLIQDPFGKKFPELGRDPSRTPMQWSSQKYAGFSRVSPWLPVAKNFKKVNIEVEFKDPESILNLYKKLNSLRKELPPLSFGNFKTLDLKNDYIFAYLRAFNNEKILVVLNFSNRAQKIILPFKNAKVVCNTYSQKTSSILRPNEGVIFNTERSRRIYE